MNQRAIDLVRELFEGLLARVGEGGRVEVRWEGEGVYVNLTGDFRRLPDDDGFRGDLSRWARLHLRARKVGQLPVVVDVNGRWAARRRELVAMAKGAAGQALREHRKVRLPPMAPEERRIIHLALADVPGVRTYSVGKGQGRRVVVEPTS
ncbi:TPA: hypothetical protein EYH33_03005 [Candidatus Bipolaricaulota bacterium]|nr:hypothetical protein [Candidatus Bipolaricaulota bacterium]